MVNPGAFQGLRKEFLLGEKPNYALAVDGGYAADGLADILRRFLKRFPLDLPDDQEPSREHFAAVDDGAADPDVAEPDPTKMTPEEFDTAMKGMKARQERFVFKQAQIKRWMAYQYRKDHDLDATESGMFNQYRALMSKLTKKSIDRPRLKTAVNVWRKTQRTSIEAECRVIIKQTKDKALAPGEKKECLIAMRSRIATRMFGELSPEERSFWELEAAAEHEVALGQWKEEMKAPVSTDPAARQRCIQGLIQFVQPILDRVSEATGWKVSMIAGGPEPGHGGQLNVISIHSGTTSGDVKMNFGRAERARFWSTVVPLYGTFLRKCYSPEQCRARALPKEEGYIPMVEQDLENESASCDSIPWEGPVSVALTTGSATKSSDSSPQSSSKPSNALKAAAPAPSKTTAHGPSAGLQATDASSKDAVNPSSAGLQATDASSKDAVNPSSAGLQATDASSKDTVNPPSAGLRATDASSKDILVDAVVTSGTTSGEPLSANQADSNENPFPFQAEETPGPSSRPPSLPPSPAHSPQGSRMGSPAGPPQTDDISGAGPMNVEADVGTQVEPTEDVESPNAVARQPTRVAQGSAVLDEEEKDGKRKGRKRAVEDAPPTTGTASGARRSKRARTSVASKAAPATQPLAPAPAPPSNTTASEPLVGAPASKTSIVESTNASSIDSANTPSTGSQLDKSPSNAPVWFKKAMSMLKSTELGKEWQRLVKNWAVFEATENYTGSGYLLATNRPTAVKDWIQRARSPTWRAAIASTETYGIQFMRWWMALQPDWRKAENGVLMAPQTQAGGWEGVRKAGINGLLSVMIALFFWGVAITPQGTRDDRWLAAVEEVNQVVLYLVSI